MQAHPLVIYMVVGACHPDKLQQVFVGNETIMKNDVLRNAEFFCTQVKAVSVILPLLRLVVRMGGAYHHIDDQRVGLHDIYVTPYQNEAQIISGTLAYALVIIGFDKRHVRDAVVYEDDSFLRYLVNIAQKNSSVTKRSWKTMCSETSSSFARI